MSLSGWIAGLSVLALIGGSQAVSAQQNKLEPPGPPGPTMKTLDEIPPTWSQILPAAQRFQLVMGGDAVLDKETGLVWEQSPSTDGFYWAAAQSHCNNLIVATRLGWRLPTIQEMSSLAVSPGSLPVGHPFTNVSTGSDHWSATTSADDTARAWLFRFNNADLSAFPFEKTIGQARVWCVRGGQGVDPQ
jgi:hypothetical protein